MFENTTWITVGKIVAAQGLQGEVRVNPSSDFPERFLKPGLRWLQKTAEHPLEIRLKSGRQIPGKSIYIVSFEGIHDRNKAESIVGQKLLVPSSNRPTLKKNEFHLLDLIGLKVHLIEDGARIGEVINLSSGGNDLLEVKLTNEKILLIPFVKEIVPEVNLEKGFIIINPPIGLLEL